MHAHPHSTAVLVARSAVARARAGAAAIALDPVPEPFSLIVDLAGEPVGRRWWRGVATLALLCSAALTLAPWTDPFAADSSQLAEPVRYQMNPMLSAAADAPPPTRPAAQPGADSKPVVASTQTAIRIQGAVTEGLYWSVRDAGVSSAIATEYLHALSTGMDVGDVAPYDRFDLVMAKSKDGEPGQLLYAALHPALGGDDVAVMKWTEDGRTGWFSGDAAETRSAGLMTPVAGRITSGFGMRYHPILHYTRFHAGIDFGAPIGTPIVAAADGQVIAAGWAGGYGREVRIAHAGGMVTLYGHMSSIAATPGEVVHQGQVIGYVGSSGLSTGPHLHFEVKIGGKAVNPLTARLQTRSAIAGADLQAFKARLKQFESIGESKA